MHEIGIILKVWQQWNAYAKMRRLLNCMNEKYTFQGQSSDW